MDPQSDSQIQDAAKEVQGDVDQWAQEWAEEKALLDPSRWWFASTGCPLIAATFGPMASAFNLCALVEYWREHLNPGEKELFGRLIPDPPWLLGINGVSLAFALTANVALLLNMVGRARFEIAQPIIVVGFLIASFILIALVAVASTSIFALPTPIPGAHWTFSQAYFYACFAAAIYFVISLLMMFTIWGALTGKYEKKFAITTSQRTLMLQTISFVAYLLVGPAIVSPIEGWRYLDGLYWADFTLLTIGIGDHFVPTTHATRTLMIFYTFGGVIVIGLIISSIRSMLIEAGSEKLHSRTTERRRQRVKDLFEAERTLGSSVPFIHRKKTEPTESEKSKITEREKREREFHAMRRIQDRVARNDQYRALFISATNAAILWFIGGLVFWYSESGQHWTYFECIYFSWVSLLTIGYGDLQPLSNAGKAFFVFWSLLAIPTLTVLISDMSDTVVKWVAVATNWLGAITIAPGDETFFAQLKENLNKLSNGFLFKSYNSTVQKHTSAEHTIANKGRYGQLPEIFGGRLSEVELSAMDEYCQSDSESLKRRDTNIYHYLLLKEIRSVLADSTNTPPKKYTYDEWAYFLKLLGHDEEDPSYHTSEYNSPKRDDAPGPQIARILDHSRKPKPWSWLSLRSPLLAQGNEPEWILQRLLSKFQSELHFQGKPGRGVVGSLPPPLSVSTIRGFVDEKQVDYPVRYRGDQVKGIESTFG